MRIKTKKDQLRERLAEIDRLIKWQADKAERARKRYDIKRDWFLSFWIASDSSVLEFVWNNEKSILAQLSDYRDVLSEQLINCN
jgi:hypothetical protein